MAGLIILDKDLKGEKRDENEDKRLTYARGEAPLHHKATQESTTKALNKDKSKEHVFNLKRINISYSYVSD